MWDELVRQHGGLPLTRISDAAAADLDGCEFLAVLVQDDELLPALARLRPAQAVAFLGLAQGPEARAEPANELLARLVAAHSPIYLLKSGRVGGTELERSIEVTEGHAAAALDAIEIGSIEWEEDPDFGYRVAAELPGIEGRDRLLLIPRFHYARTDRVYEYAARVPELKRQRAERLSALADLDAAIIDAVR